MTSIRDFTRAPAPFIDRVIGGEVITLTRHGRVVAVLAPPANNGADEPRDPDQGRAGAEQSAQGEEKAPGAAPGRSPSAAAPSAVEQQRARDALLRGSTKRS